MGWRGNDASASGESKPMIPLGEKVVVKTKRWHKQGPLSAPFRSMMLMGPSPTMSSGWVVRDGKMVQHARAVVCPSPDGEKAILELYDASHRRIVGKQPLYVKDRKIPDPIQHDELPELLREDLGIPADHDDVWGEHLLEDQGEDVLSLAYSPDELPEDFQAEESNGSLEDDPALRMMRAGGEYFHTYLASTSTTSNLGASTLDRSGSCPTSSGTLALASCGGCGLLQPCGMECSFCGETGSTTLPLSSKTLLGSHGALATTSTLSSRSGLQGALDGSHGIKVASITSRNNSNLGDGQAGERAWEFAEVHNPEELLDRVHREHWGWKTLWEKELSREAVGGENGYIHGKWLQYLEHQVVALEEELDLVQNMSVTKYDDKYKLAAVLKEGQEVPGDGHPFEGPDRARAVLQTYTVSLAEVKRDINLWKEPLQAELEALVGTGTIRRVKQSQLSQEPGYDRMEVAPAKIVPTIKSPSGKRKARIVICGNLVHQADHVRNVQMPDQEMEISDGTGLRAPQCGKGDEPGGNPGGGPDGNGPPDQSAASDLYAGGVDATALRCVLRKAAASSWSLASTDVRGAFLLAPRSQVKRPLLVIEPPRLLVTTNIVPADEKWVCEGAMYGLDTSPADWAAFRDQKMTGFRWGTEEHRCHLVKSPEPNIWSIMGVSKTDYPEQQLNDDAYAQPLGFLIVYVDDVLCAAPSKVVESTLGRLRDEWTCSEVEWVSSEKWLKFCGLQLRWRGDDLLLGQPDFARELLDRHGPVAGRHIPLPKVDPTMEVEENIDLVDVRKCQQLLVNSCG